MTIFDSSILHNAKLACHFAVKGDHIDKNEIDYTEFYANSVMQRYIASKIKLVIRDQSAC